jgi:hypothetical protein
MNEQHSIARLPPHKEIVLVSNSDGDTATGYFEQGLWYRLTGWIDCITWWQKIN